MSNEFGRSSAFRSVLLVAGSTYLSYAVGLVVSVIIARQLGPREYGQYAYIVWVAGTLNILVCNGLTLTAIRFTSESLGRGNRVEATNVYRLLRRWAIMSAALVSIAFVVASAWLQPAGWEKPVWIFAGAALAAGITKASYTFGVSISKGFGRFEIDPQVISLSSIANLLGILLMAAVGASLGAYIVFFVALSVGHAAVTHWLMRRAKIVPSSPDVAPVLRARIAENFFWSAILLLVYAFTNKSIETLVLNSYIGAEAVGSFVIAASMTRAGIELLSSGLSTVLMPIMAHAFGSKDTHRGNRIFSEALRYYFFLGLVLAGVGVLWAEFVIVVLYGSQYSQAIGGLQVMMLMGALTMPEAAMASLLTTTDHQSVRVALAIFAVLVTLIASAALIPSYGFAGAIAAHAISRFAIFACTLATTLRLLEVTLPIAGLLRMAGAALFGVAAAAPVLVVSTSTTGKLCAGGAYVIGCMGGSVALRVWTSGDLKVLKIAADRWPPIGRLEQWMARRARDA